MKQSAYLIASGEVGDDPRLLELTLAPGADVDAEDRFDGTSLIRAADRGSLTIVDRVIKAGVDLVHVNNLGGTALLEAVVLGMGDGAHQQVVARQRGYTEMVRLLSA